MKGGMNVGHCLLAVVRHRGQETEGKVGSLFALTYSLLVLACSEDEPAYFASRRKLWIPASK